MTQAAERPAAGGVALDPRVKLSMVVAANALMVMHVGPVVQAIAVMVFTMPLFMAGKARAGARMLACYALLCAVQAVAAAGVTRMPWLHVVGFTASGIAMMMPCLAAGVSAFGTTRIGDLVCTMRRLHMPDAIVIPVVVAMRFFPTIRHDCRMIRRSMRLRGHSMLRHPLRSFEYVIVPLLMNATRVADDLTVAGLTKGLGSHARPTSLNEPCMRAADWAVLAAVVALPVAGAMLG